MKILVLKINSCNECQYCMYKNPNSRRNPEAGYDCVHPTFSVHQRIVDLFGLHGKSISDFMPEWCPLDVEG